MLEVASLWMANYREFLKSVLGYSRDLEQFDKSTENK